MTNTTNTTATNTTTTNTTTTRAAELQRKVNEAAVAGAQSILGFAGNLAANGQLKMSIDIKMVAKSSEDERRYRGDRTTHAVADVDLAVHADIDGAVAITGDGSCHGQRR